MERETETGIESEKEKETESAMDNLAINKSGTSCLKVHNFLTNRVLVGQVWLGFEFATKPDLRGHSSSICLEVVIDRS